MKSCTKKFIHDRSAFSLIVLVIGIGFITLAGFMQYLPNFFEFTAHSQAWWRDLLLNIGAGLISAIAFVWLYDAALERRELQKLLLQKKALIFSLRFPLVDHYLMLIRLYKASLKAPFDAALAHKPDTLEDLFSEEYFQTIRQIDLRGPMAGLIFPQPWPEYIEQCCKLLDETIYRALLIGAHCLDHDEVELFLAIQGSFFMRTVKTLHRNVLTASIAEDTGMLPKTRNGLLPDQEEEFFKQLEIHVKNFMLLLNWCNRTRESRLILPQNWNDFPSVNPGCSRSPIV